jgi:hypothetical protein
MDPQIEQAIDEKRQELRQSLKPALGDETENVVEMLIAAFRRDYGDPAKQADHPQLLAALGRLPKGVSIRPTAVLNQVSKGGVGLVFFEGGVQYRSTRRFASEDEANGYASRVLINLYGEIQG